MTAYPEGYLARELELCYANISMVTDHDVGVEGAAPVSPRAGRDRLQREQRAAARAPLRRHPEDPAAAGGAPLRHRARGRALLGCRGAGRCDRTPPAVSGPGRRAELLPDSCGGLPRAAVTDFFQNHTVLFALLCALFGIAVGLYLTWWILQQPAGTERMREIARAVQEGAAAYLRRQYTTIGARRDRPVPPDRLLQPARLGHRDRLPDRRDRSRPRPASSA